jgi:2'-5' RNA ligase
MLSSTQSIFPMEKLPMDDKTNQDNVIVALIPQTCDWCKIDPAHLTLVFVGKVQDLKASDYNALIKDVASVAMLSNPVIAKVYGVAEAGDEEKVDVFKVASTPELLSMRHMLEAWDDSEFPTFLPHVTIGPAGSFIGDMPLYLIFDRISILWGSQPTTFWLRKF